MKLLKKIKIAPQVAVLLAFMILGDRSGIGLITVGAALLHECGHLAAAKLLHIPLGGLRMSFLGARLEISGRMLSYGEEWLLCAAGPMTSLLAAAVAAPLWQYSTGAQVFSCASLVLGALNLLPIQTFDGGRMFETALTFLGGTRLAGRLMTLCSFVFLFLLWTTAVYFLLRAGDGLSLFCFSLSLFLRFFDRE
ncbi:MAG: site-2 protease family protein [Clostridia bacterium]|nr:site-2 protease family protein [Clostridia bacterium]MBQ7348314.1 site-2 protease family protein [Clostridia bacterium]